MQAILNWDQKMGFIAGGDSGHEIKVDVSVDVGGQDSGPRPMELVLFGLGVKKRFMQLNCRKPNIVPWLLH